MSAADALSSALLKDDDDSDDDENPVVVTASLVQHPGPETSPASSNALNSRRDSYKTSPLPIATTSNAFLDNESSPPSFIVRPVSVAEAAAAQRASAVAASTAVPPSQQNEVSAVSPNTEAHAEREQSKTTELPLSPPQHRSLVGASPTAVSGSCCGGGGGGGGGAPVRSGAAGTPANALSARQQEQKQQQNELIRSCIRLMFQRVAGDTTKFNQLKQAIRQIQQAKLNQRPEKPVRLPQDLFVLVEPILGREELRSCLQQVKEEFRASRLPPPTPEQAAKLLEEQCVAAERELALLVHQQQLQQTTQVAAGQKGATAGFALRSQLEDSSSLMTLNGVSSFRSFTETEKQERTYVESLKRACREACALNAPDVEALLAASNGSSPAAAAAAASRQGHRFLVNRPSSPAPHPYRDDFGGRFRLSAPSPPPSSSSSSSSSFSFSSSSSSVPSSREELLSSSTRGPGEWFNALNRTECAMRLKRAAHDAGLRVTLSTSSAPLIPNSSSSSSSSSSSAPPNVGAPDDNDAALFLSEAVQTYLSMVVVPGVLRCGSQRRSLAAKRCGDLVEWASPPPKSDPPVPFERSRCEQERLGKMSDGDEDASESKKRGRHADDDAAGDGDDGGGDGAAACRSRTTCSNGNSSREKSGQAKKMRTESSVIGGDALHHRRLTPGTTLPTLGCDSGGAVDEINEEEDPTSASSLLSCYDVCRHDVLLYLDQQCAPPFMCPNIQARRHARRRPVACQPRLATGENQWPQRTPPGQPVLPGDPPS